MKDPRKTEASQCVLCGGRLRNAVFCPTCGRSACSWACYVRHLAQYAARTGRSASHHQGDSRRDERPDPRGEQAVAR